MLESTGPGRHTCLVMRGDPKTGMLRYDILFMKSFDKAYAGLGDPMTRGEHILAHAVDSDGIDDYSDAFSGAYAATLAMLGLHSAMREDAEATGSQAEIDFHRLAPASTFTTLSNLVGFSIGNQLISHGHVPYSRLFNARSQENGWKIVKGIVKPEMVITQTELDGNEDGLGKVFDSVGFAPRLSVVIEEEARQRRQPLGSRN